jgi:hypothetical protein
MSNSKSIDQLEIPHFQSEQDINKIIDELNYRRSVCCKKKTIVFRPHHLEDLNCKKT